MSALEQGDIIEIDFSPSVGHEPAKTRPAVVLSSYAFNSRSSLVVVAPVTSRDNGYPLHVPVRGTAGVKGFAVLEAMRSLDVSQRGYRHIGYVDDRALNRIMSLMRGVFDLR